jgi:RHS repeat-associated protein
VSEVTFEGTVEYTYDAAGRRRTMQTSGLPLVTYGYDANSRLTGITQGAQAAALAYDPASRRTSLTLPNGITIEYQYDDASRLVNQVYRNAAGVMGDLAYAYDASGSRIATGGTFARTLVPAAVSDSAYDQANQQSAFGSVGQTFDLNGNLLTQIDPSGTITYTWDARDRLVAIDSPLTSASFAYDALGRRVSKVINGITTIYRYDGLDIVREEGEAGGASYLRTLAIDEALTRTDSTGTLTYLTDILGSTLALVDSFGNPVTTFTYSPFGETSISGLSSPNPFQFTGRENDGTGLYYYRARFYESVRMRFVQRDAFGIRGGANLYSYLAGDPLSFIDPLGLFKVRIQDVGGRSGPAYGGIITVESGDGTRTVSVPGSTWPNPNNANPGILPGTYDSLYRSTGHKGQVPGIRLRDGAPIPTIGPNSAQTNQSQATGINIHCGWSRTWRGSAGCITIHPDYCQQVWDILNEGERGTVGFNRNESPGF